MMCLKGSSAIVLFYSALAFASCRTLPVSTNDSKILASTGQSPYCGCLLFVDDARSNRDFEIADSYKPNILLRSWYRWGEPRPEAAYETRQDFVRSLIVMHTLLGGGASLSVLNQRDLSRDDFDKSWLSVRMDGTPFVKGDLSFGSLSSPGFRAFVVSRLVEQAKLGVKELHLGESNGEIHFDDWSLGLRGGDGFIQWIRKKYPDKPRDWWHSYLGALGDALYSNAGISRNDFKNLTGTDLNHFQWEWGKEGSWHGVNADVKPAFIADLYRHNLDALISEARMALMRDGLSTVTIDVFGFGDWMVGLANQPDAYQAAVPDERRGINWSTDESYSLEGARDRIKAVMLNEVKTFKHVVYVIDHPKPFQALTNLSDQRQAEIMSFFAKLSFEVGANFMIQSYSDVPDKLGSDTSTALHKICEHAKRQSLCPNGSPQSVDLGI